MSDFPPPEMPPPLPPSVPQPMPNSFSNSSHVSQISNLEEGFRHGYKAAWSGLALRYAFYVMVVVQTLVALSFYQRYDFIDRVEKGVGQRSMTEANEIDSFVSAMAGLSILSSFVIFSLMIFWLFNLTRDHRIQGASFRHSNGWAIGGFFVPIANLVIPYDFLKENLRFVRGDHSELMNLIRYLQVWWFGFIGAIFINRFAANLPGETLGELKVADGTRILAAFVLIVSCVFAGFVIDTLTPKVRQS